MPCIYKIINTLENDRPYIGYSNKKSQDRWIGHLHDVKRQLSKNPEKLHNVMLRYGVENFKFSVIVESSKLDLEYVKRVLEPFYILAFDSFNNGYNLNRGGGGRSAGWKETPEQIEAKRKRMKGRKHTKERTEKRMVKIRGRKEPEEAKQKRISKLRGKKHPTNILYTYKKKKKYKLTFKDGHTEIIIGLKDFCKQRGYTESSIHRLVKKQIAYYRDIISVEILPKDTY